MRCVLGLFLLLAAPAEASQFDFVGYVDLRLVAPADDDRPWLDGGIGKLRYGKGDSNFQFAGAVGEGSFAITPELLAVTDVRMEPSQHTFADVLEAYVRYRPATDAAWRWSVKAGAFFAPFSLENTEVGWTPYWTLTPSAINSWFGDELRTVGSEGTLEWRSESGTATFIASAFGLNDPAGVMMADRGWAMDDRPSGLFDHLRIPDATLIRTGDVPPDRTPIFKEFDDRIGWYAGASWDDAKQWHLEVVHYDNEANPAVHEDDYFAWRTKFWDVGFSDHFGSFTVIGQALTGTTKVAQPADIPATTDFDSAYLLLGWENDHWRFAARGDVFHTKTANNLMAFPELSENGRALTASVSWLPKDWLRLTGELIALTSKRGERKLTGLDPQQSETQFQLSARFFLD